MAPCFLVIGTQMIINEYKSDYRKQVAYRQLIHLTSWSKYWRLRSVFRKELCRVSAKTTHIHFEFVTRSNISGQLRSNRGVGCATNSLRSRLQRITGSSAGGQIFISLQSALFAQCSLVFSILICVCVYIHSNELSAATLCYKNSATAFHVDTFSSAKHATIA